MVWLYDLLGNAVVPVHQLIELVSDDRLFKQETLEFTMRRDDQKAAYLQPDQIIRWDGRLYRNTLQTDRREGTEIFVDVYCEALWYDLQKRVRVGNYPVLAKTPEQGLTTILTSTGWNVGDTPVDANVYSIEANDATIIQLLRSWSDVTGYELSFNTATKEVNLVTTVGEARQVPFRYGRNIRGIQRQYEPPVATRLYPFGAGSLDISANEPSGNNYVEDYTWYTSLGLTLAQARAHFRKDQVWVDERYLLGINLYDAALVRIARLAQPTISYEVEIANLSEQTALAEGNFDTGDTVPVTDTEFGIDLTTRVVRRVRRPLRRQDDEIELEFLRPGLSDAELTLDQRVVDYGAIAVLVDRNEDAINFPAGSTRVWAEITITVAGTTTPVMGGTFVGTATGSGTLDVYATLDGTDIGQRISVDFTDGEQVEVSWPTFVADIGEGTYVLDWRAVVSAGTGSVDLAAEAGRGWALVRGAVGIGFASSPNTAISEEVTAVSLETMSDGVTATVSTVEILITSAEEVSAVDLDEITDDYILPFTLSHPVFGVLGGPARLAPPPATE